MKVFPLETQVDWCLTQEPAKPLLFPSTTALSCKKTAFPLTKGVTPWMNSCSSISS